jgi:hypothetical protein
MGNLYGLVSRLPDQLAIVNAHCFKTCGKIIVGAINGDALEIGPLFPCWTPFSVLWRGRAGAVGAERWTGEDAEGKTRGGIG